MPCAAAGLHTVARLTALARRPGFCGPVHTGGLQSACTWPASPRPPPGQPQRHQLCDHARACSWTWLTIFWVFSVSLAQRLLSLQTQGTEKEGVQGRSPHRQDAVHIHYSFLCWLQGNDLVQTASCARPASPAGAGPWAPSWPRTLLLENSGTEASALGPVSWGCSAGGDSGSAFLKSSGVGRTDQRHDAPAHLKARTQLFPQH